MQVNLSNCLKYCCDANSLLILNIIESKNIEDWNHMLAIIPTTWVEKYVDRLIQKELLINNKPNESFNFYNFDLRKKKKVKEKFSTELTKLAEDYYEIWPRGIVSGNGPVRNSPQACKEKLKAFLKEYSYSSEIILQATKNYVNRMKQEGFKYMKHAPYFISKDGISMLAAECELVVSGKINTGQVSNIQLS